MSVPGPLSNMGRLDCKDASLFAYQALEQDADVFVTITDEEASAAAAVLADHDLPTTPSGAASFAGVSKINPGINSRCLVVITEGREEG